LDLTPPQVHLQIAHHLTAIVVRCDDLDAAWHRNLAIPERAWPGLKQLPEMAGLSVDSQQNYISMVNKWTATLETLQAADISNHCAAVLQQRGRI
jgi:hypothetical protein